MSEWLLSNPNSAIFQLYHDKNEDNFQWDDDEVRFVLDKHAKLYFFSASLLKLQSADRHVVSLGHIILIWANQSLLFLLKAA